MEILSIYVFSLDDSSPITHYLCVCFQYIGQVGEVHSFTRTGNVTISFDDGAVWTFPRNALAKVFAVL